MQCMQKLHYIDPEYRLYFAGNFQDYGLEQYLRHIVKAMGLEGVVFFDNWQDDVEGWLADKHFVVSASISESEGMGILEAMACGLKPVIHNFPGAEEIFGSEFLFNISEDFCKQILSENYEPSRYHSFVEKRYPMNRQLAGIDGIFGQLEAEIGAHRGSGIKPAEAAGGNEGASSFKKGFGEEINKVAATTARRGF